MTSPSCPNTVSGLMSLTPGVSIGTRIMLCCPCLRDTSRKQTKCDNTGLLTPCTVYIITYIYLNDRNGPTANAQGIKDAAIKRTNWPPVCLLWSAPAHHNGQSALGITSTCGKKSPNQRQLWLMPLKPQILQQVNIPNTGNDEAADRDRGHPWESSRLWFSLGLLLIPPQIPES